LDNDKVVFLSLDLMFVNEAKDFCELNGGKFVRMNNIESVDELRRIADRLRVNTQSNCLNKIDKVLISES